MKKEQGITLISLVVTIIVLIILAGISINLILGQDGIITKTKEAKQNMELAADEEARSLNELYAQMSGESSGSISYDAIAKLVEFKKEIASAITDMGVTTAEDASAETMASNIRSFASSLNATSVNYDNTNSKLTATNVQDAVDELNDNFEWVSYSATKNPNDTIFQNMNQFIINICPKLGIGKILFTIENNAEIPVFTEIKIATVNNWDTSKNLFFHMHGRASGNMITVQIKPNGDVVIYSHAKITTKQWWSSYGVYGLY